MSPKTRSSLSKKFTNDMGTFSDPGRRPSIRYTKFKLRLTISTYEYFGRVDLTEGYDADFRTRLLSTQMRFRILRATSDGPLYRLRRSACLADFDFRFWARCDVLGGRYDYVMSVTSTANPDLSKIDPTQFSVNIPLGGGDTRAQSGERHQPAEGRPRACGRGTASANYKLPFGLIPYGTDCQAVGRSSPVQGRRGRSRRTVYGDATGSPPRSYMRAASRASWLEQAGSTPRWTVYKQTRTDYNDPVADGDQPGDQDDQRRRSGSCAGRSTGTCCSPAAYTLYQGGQPQSFTERRRRIRSSYYGIADLLAANGVDPGAVSWAAPLNGLRPAQRIRAWRNAARAFRKQPLLGARRRTHSTMASRLTAERLATFPKAGRTTRATLRW